MTITTDWPSAYFKIREHLAGGGELFFEIGTGNGEFFLWVALTGNYLCVGSDIKKKRVSKLIGKIKNAGGEGVVLLGDGKRVLRDVFPHASISKIVINYPDPWPRKGQYWRRISYSYFIRLISDRLKTGGVVHLSTDYYPIFYEFSDSLRKMGIFRPLPAKPQANLFRGVFTRYETQWVEEGRNLFQWSFLKKEDYIDDGLVWEYAEFRPVKSKPLSDGYFREVDGWIVKVVYDRGDEVRLLIVEKESKISYNLAFRREKNVLFLVSSKEVVCSEKLQKIIEEFFNHV